MLLGELVGYLDDNTWCERNGLGLTDLEYAQYSWAYFCDVVMRRRRYFFLDYGSDPSEPEVYDPGHILRNIFDSADELGLFKELPAGTHLYPGPAGKSQMHSSKHLKSWVRPQKTRRLRPIG